MFPFNAHSNTPQHCARLVKDIGFRVLFHFQFYVFFIRFHGFSTYFLSFFFSFVFSHASWLVVGIRVGSTVQSFCMLISVLWVARSSKLSPSETFERASTIKWNVLFRFNGIAEGNKHTKYFLYFHRLAQHRNSFFFVHMVLKTTDIGCNVCILYVLHCVGEVVEIENVYKMHATYK